MILIVTPSPHRRRIDMRLLPILGVMYSMSLIDRTNLGLALVAGMQEDLGLAVGSRYTIIVMVFFVTYMYDHPDPGHPHIIYETDMQIDKTGYSRSQV